MTTKLKEQTIDKCAGEIFERIDFKPKLRGYPFVMSAVEKYYQDGDKYKRKFYTLMYDEIAKEFHTNNKNVEKAIRKAVEITWTKGNAEELYELYGSIVSKDKGKATSKDFIIRTVELIRVKLEQ